MKKMLAEKHVSELLQRKSLLNENSHPIATTGQTTIERIMTIDPNNVVSMIRSFEWRGELLYGVIETIDDGPNGKGTMFMRNILQGIEPAYSLRSLVPQRKNPDNTIIVTGSGRYVTHDRVILPSHEEAYIDKSVPVKNIITKPQFQTVMESFTDFVLERSNKINRIIDNLDPVTESANIDKNGLLSINTREDGKLLIFPENKYRKEISSFFKNL